MAEASTGGAAPPAAAQAPTICVFARRAGVFGASEVTVAASASVARLAKAINIELGLGVSTDLIVLSFELEDKSAGPALDPYATLAEAGVEDRSRIIATVLAPPPSTAVGAASVTPDDIAKIVTRLDRIAAEQAPMKTQVDRILAQLAAADDASSAMTEEEYEVHARATLPGLLLQRCSLEVVRGVDHNRANFLGQEWDFRAPVTIAHTAPNPNAELNIFEVFPATLSYTRPPAIGARHVTPTKMGGGEPPSAEYLALFEFTTTKRWTWRHPHKPGLLQRLETRLRLTLSRAREKGYLTTEQDITHLVAAVGVVAPEPYTASVRDLMGKPSAPVLLKQLMEAGRFVFFAVPRTSSPVAAHR